MISSPRFLIVGLAALFSGYHLVLAVYSMGVPRHPGPIVVAMVLYATMTIVSLWAPSKHGLPVWIAALNVAVGLAMSILVLSQLDSNRPNGYATWFVAAALTLMVITAVRRRPIFAWVGVAVVGASIVIWSDVLALTTTGVVGGAIWVAVGNALVAALARAEMDAAQYAQAGIKAAEWQANQEALLFERRVRLEQMTTLAAPMLRRIVSAAGVLSEDERRECLYVEAAIRDEIRGRLLLSDAVRAEVMAARRRGVHVTVLDDGGLDDLAEADRLVALDRVAEAISAFAGDRLIIRTGVADSPTAVSVVGLRESGGGHMAAALGEDSHDDEVLLWKVIPRTPSLAMGGPGVK